MARKKAPKVLTEEEKAIQKQEQLNKELVDLIKDYKIPFPNNPERIYKIGDRVRYGNHDKSIVLEVTEDKRFYKLETSGVRQVYGIETAYHQIHWESWVNLYPYIDIEEAHKREVFSPPSTNDIRLSQYNSSIDSMPSMVYRFGVDFDVEYQRGYVWSIEDKENLIESILNKIEIGKLLFVQREWDELVVKDMNGYEILDGKQRLSTIMEFLESRFKYKGKFFHQLSPIDQDRFCNYPISYLVAKNLNEQDRIKLFIKFNTSGKVMDKTHIDNVKKLLK